MSDAIPFSPVWLTPPGRISMTGEAGSTYNPVLVSLAAEVRATVPVALGQTYIVIGSTAASEVSDVRFGTISLQANVTADGVLFPPLRSAGAVDIVLDRPITFTRISGEFPPGVSISSDGVIDGTVGQIMPITTADSGTATYEVVVRASTGGVARDRTFEIDVAWRDAPSRWSTEYQGVFLVAPPDQTTIPRGAPFSYAFVVEDDDSLPSPAILTGALPLGLRYDPTRRRIDGIVALSAAMGTYGFTLSIGANPRQFSVVVVDRDPDQPLSPPLSLGWVTPAGSLGSMRDNDLCAFDVRAEATNNAPITYAVVGGAGSLPPGLRVDRDTGHIRGTVTGGNGIYAFAIRARLGGTFEDRVFSITVTEFYSAPSLITLALRVPGPTGDAILANYETVLAGRDLFRPTDPDYGIAAVASIYLLGGMNADDAALEDATGDDPGPGMPQGGFHQWLELRLSGHGVITVTQRGRVLYEMLARALVDPLGGVGGFFDDGTHDPVPYPPDPGIEVRSPSLTNLRHDLARDIGFATSNPALRHRLGLDGGEAMPVWMRGGLIDYFPILPVAFLAPGEGAAALQQALAAEGTTLPANGTPLGFSGYATRRVLRPSGVIEDGFIPLRQPRSGRSR